MAATHVGARPLFGRDEELERALGHGRRAPGTWTVAIAGEAGIGKTALVDAVVAALASDGRTVLCCSGVQAEAKLGYAALGDLLDGLPGAAFETLPPPQVDALEVALLRRRASVPAHQRAIGMGVRGVLRRLAADAPVVIVVDDEHWLDASTASVLAFALRRLVDEPVGLLTAFRAHGGGAGRLAASVGRPVELIELGPLSLDALVALLDAEGIPLRRRVAARIHALSCGNPLLALELARTPVGDSAEGFRALRARVEALGGDAGAAVLHAAALQDPTTMLLESALGVDPARAGLAAASAAGILRLEDERIRFAHPLFASVAYETADEASRRAAHARLGALVLDVEQRARHLVLSTAEPDPGVAALAEHAARGAYERGAPDAASELLAESLRATPAGAPDDVARRTVDLGRLLFEIGESERSRRLLEDFVARWPPGPERARALHALGVAASFERNKAESARFLAQALCETGGDPGAEMLVRTELSWASDLPTSACIGHAEAALALADRVDDGGLVARALIARVYAGGLADEPPDLALLERAAAAQRDAAVRPNAQDDAAFFRGIALVRLDQPEAASAQFQRLLASALERGEEGFVAELHMQLARLAWFRGRLDEAERGGTAVAGAAARVGHALLATAAGSLLLHVAAARGPGGPRAASLSAQLERAATAGDRWTRTVALAGVGFGALAGGRAEEAASALDEVQAVFADLEIVDGGLRQEGNHIEALIACAREDDAEPLLARLEARWERLPRAWIGEVAGRCRALLDAAGGDVTGASDRLAAIAATTESPSAFERGRTLLALGRLERRRKRKAPARDAFSTAEQAFARVGAYGWAALARDERARVGGRPASSWTELTPTERAIAEAVAAGRSNADAALLAHVSVHTVEANLTRVYRKLGLRGRTELAARLAREPQLLQRGSVGQT